MSGLAVAEPPAEYWEVDPFLEPEPVEEGSALERTPEADQSEIRFLFDQLADELGEDASVLSSTRRAMELPAFDELVALGEPAIPLIMERIDKAELRPVWMRLLATMTTFEPAAGSNSIDEAARRWIRWSKSRGSSSARA
jgi:hypothetical protein